MNMLTFAKLLAALAFLLFVACLLVILKQKQVAAFVLERGAERQLGRNVVDSLDDGLHLTLCGAGGPLPARRASGPCVAVVAGKRLFVVDAGTNGVRNLGRMNFQAGTIQGVFLTHFHSDHIDGLGEMGTLRWAGGGNRSPLPVHGPAGVEQVVAGFNTAYAQDANYRNAHHGDAVAPLSGAGLQAAPFNLPAPGELAVVLEGDGLTVEALAVDHAPVAPAVGYRFRYKGRSLLITGDTVQSRNIRRFAEGVDLLVHEALAPNIVKIMHEVAQRKDLAGLAKITADIPNYHASPLDAAQTAREAEVGHLLYYHIVPPMNRLIGYKLLFLDGAHRIFRDYTIGRDGTTFSLPADSTKIIKSRKRL